MILFLLFFCSQNILVLLARRDSGELSYPATTLIDFWKCQSMACLLNDVNKIYVTLTVYLSEKLVSFTVFVSFFVGYISELHLDKITWLRQVG